MLRSYILALHLRDTCGTDTLWQSHFGVQLVLVYLTIHGI